MKLNELRYKVGDKVVYDSIVYDGLVRGQVFVVEGFFNYYADKWGYKLNYKFWMDDHVIDHEASAKLNGRD